MLHILNGLREITLLSVFVRMALAMICGGIIGAERESKRRPAGFRTHILICLGAAMTTMTSQYLSHVMGYYTDIGRLGAQVIAGVGFIGAGTIIVTRRQHIKGLTTAAGLWVSAIIGISLGAGFFEVGVMATVFTILAELLFVRWEYSVLDHSPETILYLEYNDKHALETVLQTCREKNVSVQDMEFTRQMNGENTACMILSLRMNKNYGVSKFLADLRNIENLLVVEEL